MNPRPQDDPGGLSNQLTTFTNIAGAAVSLALVAGIGVWGYKLVVRDVSGIPVVRAAEGEMRVRPENPGGELARHQGLSVNQVAAEGGAAKPADRLILAPKPIDLTQEDQVMPAAVVADAPQVAEPPTPLSGTTNPVVADVSAALESGDVDALVAQLTDGIAPLSDTADAVPDAVTAAVAEALVTEVTEAEEEIAALRDAPGVRQSMRPQIRPVALAQVTRVSFETVTPAPAVQDVDPATLPAGTRLAQLGAFDSADVARAQWDQISTRFDAYMTDKSRVIQRATSGGRVFYRLRVMGFEDIADARRFCSELVARKAECIPVVTR